MTKTQLVTLILSLLTQILSATPIWHRPDSLIVRAQSDRVAYMEDYTTFYPYLYCNGNPVMFIDTDGKDDYCYDVKDAVQILLKYFPQGFNSIIIHSYGAPIQYQ